MFPGCFHVSLSDFSFWSFEAFFFRALFFQVFILLQHSIFSSTFNVPGVFQAVWSIMYLLRSLWIMSVYLPILVWICACPAVLYGSCIFWVAPCFIWIVCCMRKLKDSDICVSAYRWLCAPRGTEPIFSTALFVGAPHTCMYCGATLLLNWLAAIRRWKLCPIF